MELGEPVRLADRRFGTQVTEPFALQIEFTSDCQLRCVMCPLTTGSTASSATPGARLSAVVWADLLEQAERAGQVFVAGFGEPLLNPKCLDLLGDLNERRVRTSFVTNGLAVTADVARRLAGLEHLVHVNVSIDSPDPDVYRRVRHGSLRRALAGLGHLANVMPLDRLSVSSVAMADNIESLTAFPELLHGFGVAHFVVQGVADYNDFSRSQHVADHVHFTEVIDRIRAACDERAISLDLALPARTGLELDDPAAAAETFFRAAGAAAEESRICVLPWELPYVDANGAVFSCCNAASVGAPAVDQLGERTLAEVWVDVPFQRFRRSMVDGRTLPEVCRMCTSAPIGPHPFARFWASVKDQSTDSASGDELVVVRNDGAEPWTADTQVRVGVIRPRDGVSAFETDGWLSPNRPAELIGGEVAPGSIGTIRIPIAAGVVATQWFQLVVDDVCWLPGTEFEVVRCDEPRRSWRRQRRSSKNERSNSAHSASHTRDQTGNSWFRRGS
ncbi:MAG: radical SAM protein [Microthrixaceae bacterium]